MITAAIATPVAAVLVILALGLLALVVVARLMGRRESAPAPVFVSGSVPPARDWVPAALSGVARRVGGEWSWVDLEEHGVLTGHRGELRTRRTGPPTDSRAGGSAPVVLVELQPHTTADALPPGARLPVLVSVMHGPQRAGWRRLLCGPGPGDAALLLRRRVQHAVRDAARAQGALATVPRRPATGTALVGVALVLAVILGAVIAPPVVDFLRREATRTAPVRPQPPESSRPCPPRGDASGHPARSAVGRGDGREACPFAEAVRQRYRTAPAQQRTRLRVVSPSTRRTSTVRCSGIDLITCTRGSLTIYLYTP